MPERIVLELWWSERFLSPTYFEMHRSDLEQVVQMVPESQSTLFTFVDMDTWKNWILFQLHHEPEKIIVDTIKF